MAIIHIVHFGYKGSEVEKREVATRFLGLKTACVSSETKEPYIVSVTGGANNSPEDAANGLEHSFIVVFANEKDRNYYVSEDPAHQKFKDFVKDRVSKVTVLDFEDGKF